MEAKAKSLAYHLSTLPDPRKVRGQRHVLLDIILIAVLATICGVGDWEGIEEFGKEEEPWLRTFLELPNRIPSHDTFNRVFQMLEPRAFGEVFLDWVRGIRDKIPGEVVALDGKTLRSSMSEGKPALHVVSAWSTANRLVPGQRAVHEKSNEITAIPELLKVLDLKGCIVTIDAMGCQRKIAQAITAKKADYVLAVKGNQELWLVDQSKDVAAGRNQRGDGIKVTAIISPPIPVHPRSSPSKTWMVWVVGTGPRPVASTHSCPDFDGDERVE